MPVLAAKLHPPRPRSRLVARTRLTDRLRADGSKAPRLVLVAAPAGFGKTTLLAQWLAAPESSPRRVAWLALDPGDADLRLFLTHVVAAIQTVEPEAGDDALFLLEAGAATSSDDVLVSLINDLDVLAKAIASGRRGGRRAVPPRCLEARNASPDACQSDEPVVPCPGWSSPSSSRRSCAPSA